MRFIPFLGNYLVYPSITGTLVNLVALSPWSTSIYMYTCSPFFEEAPLEMIQYNQNRATNKLVASVKYLWVLANPLGLDLGVG